MGCERNLVSAAVVLLLLTASAIAQSATSPTSPVTSPLKAPFPSSVVPPVKISAGSPCAAVRHYPSAALAAGAQGTAIVSFVITTSGTVRDAKVVQSSGNDALDSASIECVLPWQFKPATQNGVPIEVVWSVRQNWRI